MEVEFSTNAIGENDNKNNITTSDNANMEITIDNKKSKYDYTKKMELKKKIEKIKKKEFLVDIFKILTAETKDYSENNNGIFIFFHELSDETYEKVESYVNNIYKIHKNTTNLSTNVFNSEISEIINDYSDKNLLDNKNLTNKEKIILKRKMYEEYISNNQD
jgi:hypothetical protein